MSALQIKERLPAFHESEAMMLSIGSLDVLIASTLGKLTQCWLGSDTHVHLGSAPMAGDLGRPPNAFRISSAFDFASAFGQSVRKQIRR